MHERSAECCIRVIFNSLRMYFWLYIYMLDAL